MRPPTPFHARQLKLELELFSSNEKLINEGVEGYTEELRRYEKRYRRAVRGVEGPSSYAEVMAAARDARAVLVGDYHTFEPAQRAFVRLLEAEASGQGPLTVALEMLLGEHQEQIDRFLAGHITESTFLRRIDHAKHWPFGPPDTLRRIFDLARGNGWKVIGVDARIENGSSLKERDRFAARRIAEAIAAEPAARVFVLIGEMHLAPQHLPAEILRQFGRRKLTGSVLRIHQNPDTLWFEAASRKLAEDHDVLKISETAFALMTASPVVCQQSFLTWLEQTDDGPEEPSAFDPAAGERIIQQSLQVIGGALEIPVQGALRGVEVVGPADLSFFERLRASKKFSRQEMKQIREHILSSESCYIPKAEMIYLATLSLNHAAEEAAHRLRHVTSGEGIDEPAGLVDAFYSRVMNEAIGFLGSKIVNPKRRAMHAPDLQALLADADDGPRDELERRALLLTLEHKRLEQGEEVTGLASIFSASADLFNAVTHLIGYILGDQLYYALARNKLSRDDARALFFEPFDEEGAALMLYLELEARVRAIRPPRRPALREPSWPARPPRKKD